MTGRKRTAAIQVRVTPQEKRQMIRQARRAGLSLSEYFRQSTTNRPPANISPQTFRALYAQAERLRKPIYSYDPAEGDYQLEKLLRQIMAAYTESWNPDGDNEDLANQG